MAYALGIDIGGTKTAAAVVNLADGTTLGFTSMPTPAGDGADAILNTAVVAAMTAVAAAPQPPVHCGVGTAGVVGTGGVIESATSTLTGWAGADVGRCISAALHLPVAVLNDGHAAALGESRYGAGAGMSDVLVMAIGTGIGGGFVHNGRLVRGANGLAGSLGHLAVMSQRSRPCSCGRTNHVEAWACGPAMEQEYARMTGDNPRLPAIADLARAGNPVAAGVIRTAATLIGTALAQAVNLLDPDIVVLTGGVSALFDLMEAPIRQALDAQALPGLSDVAVCATTLGSRGIMLGATSAEPIIDETRHE